MVGILKILNIGIKLYLKIENFATDNVPVLFLDLLLVDVEVSEWRRLGLLLLPLVIGII